jgi:hypothetical protein
MTSGNWIRSEQRRPTEGAVVLAYWNDGTGGISMDTAEYHRVHATHELNAHIWHRPHAPDDDYREPEFWMPLPDAPA